MEYLKPATEVLADLRSFGMTQKQISESAGIPQSTVSKLERGVVTDVLSSTYINLVNLRRKAARRRATQEPAHG